MFTHDLPLVTQADQILYLEQGQVLERGTHRELMRHNGSYATLFRMQSAIRHEQTPISG